MTFRVGLIVNPVAGLGGEASFAGSDGVEIQAAAREAGFVSNSHVRAGRAVDAILARVPEVEFFTGDGPMGADVFGTRDARFHVARDTLAPTTRDDSVELARALEGQRVDLLIFSGGDGTARDIADAIADRLPALGIPAGVKMHSSVFAVTPERAGVIVASVAAGSAAWELAPVIDIDEKARRAGVLGSRLYGHLRVPAAPRVARQAGKAGSQVIAPSVIGGIAAELQERRRPEDALVLGPGTTVRDIATSLGCASSTLLGFDVLMPDGSMRTNVDGHDLDELSGATRCQVVVSPIGGQGILLGRGNQQLNETVLTRLDPRDLLIISSPDKLAQFAGVGLLVDAPTSELNDKFRGVARVITGYREETAITVS